MTQITTAQEGAVLTATFNNPPHGFMDGQTAGELTGLLDQIEKDESIRVVVFTGGSEDIFIRHYDVGELEATSRHMADKGMTFDVERPVPESPYLACLRRIETMSTIFIAAINGTAMGGGFELCLACDIRLVKSGNHDLGLPEINIGILPGAGGTQRLPRLIGEGRALEMMLLGRTIKPEEALRLGIVSECVGGDVVARAHTLGAEIAGKSANAVAHIKQLVRGSTSRSIDEGLAEERTLFCDLMVDPEALTRMNEMNTGERDIRDRKEVCDQKNGK
jgi:enoyl-CoA hydratase/carnithine racemase